MRAMTPPSLLRGCPSCGMSPKRYSLPQITLISTRKVSKNLDMSHKKIIFSLYKTTTTIMSNTMVAVNMKICLCIEGAYSSSSGSTPLSCSSMKLWI